MKSPQKLMAAAALLAVLAPGAFAQSVDPGIAVGNSDKLSMNVFGRGQMLGVLENVADPVRNNDRVYLFMKESRMGLKGDYDGLFKYDVQMAYGGEDANGSNTDMSLLDFSADVPVAPLGENTILKVGQFRVPFGREGLTDTGYMDFHDRSIASMADYQGRDYGLAIMGTKGNFTGTVGTFSGGGPNVPQRYLPENLGVPEVVARVGYNDGVDQDIYHVVQQDLNLNRTTKAAYLSALFTRDTAIGHSTPLLVHTNGAPNLLINPDYNPYINNKGNNAVGSANTLPLGDMYQFEADGVIRHPLGNGQSVEGEVEGSWGGYQNTTGIVHIASARAQGDYQIGQYGIALRYALLSMDDKAGYIGTATGASGPTNYHGASMGEPIQEITPSLTWHVKGDNLKIVADLSIYPNCPTFLDPTLGMYAFPDPTATNEDTVAGGTHRSTVSEARMMFQFMF